MKYRMNFKERLIWGIITLGVGILMILFIPGGQKLWIIPMMIYMIVASRKKKDPDKKTSD